MFYKVITSHNIRNCEEVHYVRATDAVTAGNKLRSRSKDIVLGVEPVSEDEYFRGLVNEGTRSVDAVKHIAKSLKGAV